MSQICRSTGCSRIRYYSTASLVNDDVVEEIKNLLVISKADHIEDPESLEDKSEK